ncbi:MAG TPA: hypothetical protein VHE83_11540 [Mycobacteriales bacterium]|nr:hypothetical protein [Mycobacteriales bacterium]
MSPLCPAPYPTAPELRLTVQLALLQSRTAACARREAAERRQRVCARITGALATTATVVAGVDLVQLALHLA